jgi:hypothetical protein
MTSPSPAFAQPEPVAADYRPFDHWSMYDYFSRARREAPVFFCREIGYWVVSRRDDVLAIFRDPDRFSAAIALSPVRGMRPETLAYLKESGFAAEATQVSTDRPKHTRIRNIAGRLLSAKEYARLEPDIRAIVSRFADRLEGRETVDLVADFAYELPALVIFLMLGIPDADTAKIKSWADKRLLLTFGELTAEEERAAAAELVDYWRYCVAMVEDRQRNPRDDYASRLLAARDGDDGVLTLNEIASLVFGLLLAGHETTTNMTANAVHALLTHPEAWQRLVADPTLIPGAIEEALRFASSVVCWRRRTLADVEVAGIAIPAGQNILLALGSANRDEAHFHEPERFDIARANAREHLSFGNGIHFCLGAPLARLELRIILEELVRRFPSMTLADDALPPMIRTIAFRGPQTLLVRPHGPGRTAPRPPAA